MLNLGIPNVSREFHKFTRAISDSKSKQEEERVIFREISLLKLNFQNKHLSQDQLRDYLLRCLYIEMLGFNTKFAYIHAVNMAQSKQLSFKSTGYLCCMLMLEANSDLILLLINTIQKDLQSINFMDRLLVLNCLCYLINEEMLPIVLPLIASCLSHENEFIRKRTIVLYTRVYELFPDYIKGDILNVVQKGLCDLSPSVMNVTLNLLHLYISKHSMGGKNGKTNTADMNINLKMIVSILLNIWRQILDNKLSRDYNHHKVNAPFIQLNIIRLLRQIYTHMDATTTTSSSGGGGGSNGGDDVEVVVMKFVQSIENKPMAIVVTLMYQLIQLLAVLKPTQVLLAISTQYISKMLSRTLNNELFVGIMGINILYDKGLVLPLEDQLKVINLLENEDLTLQNHIIKLLYKLTNENNYGVVLEQIINFLKSKQDLLLDFEKDEIVFKLIGLCREYCKDVKGNVKIILQVVQLTRINYKVLYLVIDLIKRQRSQDLNNYVLSECVQMLRYDPLNEILVKLVTWVLHYIHFLHHSANHPSSPGQASGGGELNVAFYKEVLRDIFDRSHEYNDLLLYWVLNNYRSILIYSNHPTATTTGSGGGDGIGLDNELLELMRNRYVDVVKQLLVEINNINNTKRVDYDCQLTFLKDYVKEGIEKGCRLYNKTAILSKYNKASSSDDGSSSGNAAEEEDKLIYKPYLLMTNSIEPANGTSTTTTSTITTGTTITTAGGNESKGLIKAGNKLWGPKGYNQPRPSTTTTTTITTAISSGAPNDTTTNPSATTTSSNGKEEQGERFNIDNVILEKIESQSSWSKRSAQQDKNEHLAKQLFSTNNP